MSRRQGGHKFFRDAGGADPFSKWVSRNSGGGEIYVEVPVPGGCGGARVDDNDDTAGHCVRGTRCGQDLELWTDTLLKDGDVGHLLPASHDRVGDYVRWAGLWT